MNVARPFAAVAPSLEGDVLVALAGAGAGLTGREVARMVRRGSQTGINRALARLAEQGLIEGTPGGRAIFYALNRDHLAFPAVEILAGLRLELIKRFKERFASWALPAFHGSLFGSAARGDGDLKSDLDLFLVRPRKVPADDADWRIQIDELSRDAARWTGNQLSIAEVSVAELARLRQTRPPIVESLERDAITLVGNPVRTVLKKAK